MINSVTAVLYICGFALFMFSLNTRTVLSYSSPVQSFVPISRQIFYLNVIFLGFEKPSAIQQRAIKPIVKGRDVIAQ